MNTFEKLGILYKKFDTVEITSSFKKREFVLECVDNPKYPQHIRFSLTQQKVDLLDSFQVEDIINVKFFINGKEWTNKEGKTSFINTLEVFKIEKVKKDNEVTKINKDSKGSSNLDTEDDLPF